MRACEFRSAMLCDRTTAGARSALRQQNAKLRCETAIACCVSTGQQRRCSMYSMSSENLDRLHHAAPKLITDSHPYRHPFNAVPTTGRPIAYSKYPHRAGRYKRFVPQKDNRVKNSQPKGIIFIWPQERNFYYEREYAIFVKIVSQLFYWLDVLGLFPSGKGAPIKRPVWTLNQPLPKPENRDYIIEPDWNSAYS